MIYVRWGWRMAPGDMSGELTMIKVYYTSDLRELEKPRSNYHPRPLLVPFYDTSFESEEHMRDYFDRTGQPYAPKEYIDLDAQENRDYIGFRFLEA